MSCAIKLENKQDSILFNTIFNNITNQNEDLAKEYYDYFQTNGNFLKDFATDENNKTIDWVEDFKKPFLEREINQRRVDENGQPRLEFDNKYGKYYYLNQNNIKVYYPITDKKLNSLFTNEVIRSTTKRLALNFVTSRIGDNFNDFDVTENLVNLRTSIENKIKSKVLELKKSPDMTRQLNGVFLEQSLDNIDEWVKHVENYFRELKLVYKETTEVEDMLDEEEGERGASYDKASFEKSTKDNISANIKLRLSLLVDTENLDPLFLEPELRSFDDVYGTLLASLTDKTSLVGEDLFKMYLNEIATLSGKKQYLKDLLPLLKEMHPYLQAEFVQAFNLHRNMFIGTIYEVKEVSDVNPETGEAIGKKNIIIHSVQNLSNVGGKNRFIKNNWYHNFTQLFAVNNLFNNTSLKGLKELASDFKTIKPNEENLIESKLKVRKLLENMGIATTPEGFNHYLDNLNNIEIDNAERVQKLIKLINSVTFFVDKLTVKSLNNFNINPFDDQNEFNVLANAHSFYLNEGSDASIFTTGKSKWLYSYPSYLSTRIKEWKKDRNILLNYYLSTPYTKGSFYMKFLLGLDLNVSEEEQIRISKERIEDFNIAVFNSLQEMGDAKNAEDNKSISKNDFFADIYNKMLSYKKVSGKSYINTATPADKSTQYQFELTKGMTIDSNTRYVDGKAVINETAQEILYNYTKSEFNRMKVVQEELVLAESTGDNSKLRMFYHLNGNERANGLNFQLFTSLNFENFNASESGFSLYNEDGTIVDMDLDVVKDKIIELINETVSKDIIDTYKHIRNIGLINLNELGQEVNKGFDTEIWDSYGNSKSTGLKIAGDVYINGLISQIEYSKMFSGDVAYYKNMTDYKKRIPATYTDGLQLYLKEGQETYNVAIIEDVLITSPFNENLKELFTEKEWKSIGKYYERKVDKDGKVLQPGIDSTDAQAWITPERWKFLKQGLGKWANIDDIVFDKLMEINKEPFTLEELKRAAQPLKGVYFEINGSVPTYLKYSQSVLLPKIVKNNPGLKRLADQMAIDNVDELITFQGIKVGSNIPTKSHNENGQVSDNFKLTPLTLKNSGWKLQQDLPTKTFKETAVGSQVQKNIFAGLAFNPKEEFLLDGESINGENLLDYINSIVETLSNKGKTNFQKEFGISSNNKITNISKLNKVLVDELKTRRAPQNVIDALESGLSPFGIPGYQQKLQNIFASISLKRLVKIQTNGGAFIQMANYGFSKDEANSKGVIWTPWAMGTTHEPTFLKDDNGEFILSPQGRKIIRPGGVLISGSFIAKYVPDYAKKTQAQLFGTKEKNYTDGLIDQKILRNIVSYRIPNQALASNDAIEVVGILPEEIGDTIITYTGITTKTGSDFDIDKMYLMMPSFKVMYKNAPLIREYIYKNLKGKTLLQTSKKVADLLDELGVEDSSQLDEESIVRFLFGGDVKDILNHDVNELVNFILHSDSKSKLLEDIKKDIPGYNTVSSLQYIKEDNNLQTNSIKGLQNKLIEAYKAVLTNPKVIKEVMTPIDYSFIKDDEKDLFPIPPSTNLSDFNLINEIELKYQFIAGKAGVGQTANAVVDHVRGMMATLGFHNYNLGIGKVNDKNETTFDSEYSQPLSDEDFDYYNKVVKSSDKSLKKINIANSLSALLNAYVDIAKDPYITRGNWTTQTANVGFMLLRAGVHPYYVNALIGQPVIKEYINFITNAESKINKNTGNIEEKYIESKLIEELESFAPKTIGAVTRNYRTIYETIKFDISAKTLSKMFKTAVTEEQVEEVKKVIFVTRARFKNQKGFKIDSLSLKDLREQIKGKSNPEIQMNIFHTFIEWQNQAKKIKENNDASKVDVSGYGKNVTSLIIMRNLIHNLVNNDEAAEGNFKGFSSKLVKDGKYTLLGAYTENIINFIGDVMEANPSTFLIANPTVINTFNEISKGIYGDVLLSEKLATKLENSYYSYIMSGFGPLKMTLHDRWSIVTKTVDILDAYKKTSDNVFIKELEIKTSESGMKFIGMSNRKKSATIENDLTTSWLDLMNDNPELSTMLIKYSFITSGFQMSMNQFYSYIPYEWFAKNNLNDYIMDTAIELNSIDTKVDSVFIKDFFRANKEDYQVTKKVFDNNVNAKFPNNDYGFVLVPEEDEVVRDWVKKAAKSPEGNPIERLYRLIGYTKAGGPIYIASESLGYADRKGFKILEYNKWDENNRSIFPINQLTLTPAITGPFYALIDAEKVEEAKEVTISAEEIDTRVKTEIKVKPINMAAFTNHSGGAIGSDSEWDYIGEEFGMVNNKHYYLNNKTPKGNVDISGMVEATEGPRMVAQAAKAMWGYKYATMKDEKLIRNWAQVKNSDAVFAISSIGKAGDVWKADLGKPKDEQRVLIKDAIQGGTGYAVEMAIQQNKPVYVFDQNESKWFTWNGSEFIEINTPSLTKNFAGIGTREITEIGKQAITDVYINTLQGVQNVMQKGIKINPNQLDLFDDNNDPTDKDKC